MNNDDSTVVEESVVEIRIKSSIKGKTSDGEDVTDYVSEAFHDAMKETIQEFVEGDDVDWRVLCKMDEGSALVDGEEHIYEIGDVNVSVRFRGYDEGYKDGFEAGSKRPRLDCFSKGEIEQETPEIEKQIMGE